MPPGGMMSGGRGPVPPPIRRHPMAPPLEVPDDIIEEVLLRISPDDPGALVRAAAACKNWSRLIKSSRFMARYRDLHRTPTLLGYVSNVNTVSHTDLVRFDPASSSTLPHHFHLQGCRALDARDGRILLCNEGAARVTLLVLDPFTGKSREVPPPEQLQPAFAWNAAFLCSERGSCKHISCRNGGDFLLILIRDDPNCMGVILNSYSSITTVWSQKITEWSALGIDDVPPTIVRNIVYFCLNSATEIMGYDLESEKTECIYSPSELKQMRQASLFSTPEEELGLACVVESKIYLWGWHAIEGTWSLSSSLNLGSPMLFSELSACVPIDECIIIGGQDGIYEFKYGRIVTKKVHCPNIWRFIPFVAVPLFLLHSEAADGSTTVWQLGEH